MNYLFPGSFELSEVTTSPVQASPIDDNPTPSPVGEMYSTLPQLPTHVEREKLERTTLKQLVQRLRKDFALLQPQIESLDRPPTSKFSLVTIENKIKVSEKRLSTETCRYNSRLNSLQHQLSARGGQICQFEHSFSVETPNHFQHLVSGVSCRVSHNAKQAITLNSASSKFRNDIVDVITATYRMNG